MWRGAQSEDGELGVSAEGLRVHGVASPEPVPQRVQLPVHGLGGLCDILQLVLQPPADRLGPGSLLLGLLQLPLQLLHSKVALLQLVWESGRRVMSLGAALTQSAPRLPPPP